MKKLFLLLVVFFIFFTFLVPLNHVEGAVTLDNVDDEIPKEFIPIYQKAAKKYGVSWFLLASVHNQETTFSSNVSVSTAGAIGHTQFMRCTWLGWSYAGCKGTLGNSMFIDNDILKNPVAIKMYGGYGVDGDRDGKADPWNIVDAVYGMAKYLSSGMKEGADDKVNVKAAAIKYNHSNSYANEVYNRYKRYSDEWSGKSPEGTTTNSGVVSEGLWGDDLDIEVGEGDSDGGSSSDIEIEDNSVRFNDYKIEIYNVGVNLKSNYNEIYSEYKVNKLVKFIMDIIYNITFALGIFLLCYLNILWFSVLLARTSFAPAYRFVSFITLNNIDAFDKLGKLIKLSSYMIFFIVLSLGGFIPVLFVIVYSTFSDFISLVFLT